jgi:ATP/maltotriose-dependent transcriptional regulator MalT
MVGSIFRFIIIFAALFLTVWFAIDGEWLLSLGSILVLVIYFWAQLRAARVYLAWLQVGRQKFDKAQASIDKIKEPEKLTGANKGYYFMTKGVLLLVKQKLDPAEKAFKTALNSGLKTENDQALIYLQLAGIEMSRGNKKQATTFIEKSKKLKHHKALDAEIVKLEAMMKQVSKQQRQAMTGGGKGGRQRFR